MKNWTNKFTNSENVMGWLFIIPALLGTLIFIIIPVFCSFGLSFTKWDLLNPVEYVGLRNYCFCDIDFNFRCNNSANISLYLEFKN